MQRHNKHIIQPGETLKSISEKYDVTVDVIKYFHNNNCPPKDQILIDITQQKEVFLPRDIVADKTTLVDFSNGNNLDFKPEHWKQNFGVLIKIENGDSLKEIKYETSVRWLKTENKVHYFEIDRISKIFINEEEVNDIADLLAYKTSKVLYPLIISVDENGKYISVEDIELYKTRWEAVKEDVYKGYEGEIVDEFCLKIERILYEPELLNLYLKNDYFLRTLFFGLYQPYGNKYKIEGFERFPIIVNPIEPQYKIEVEIDPLKDDYDLVNIEGHGTLYDERSIHDFVNNSPFSFLVDELQINTNGDFRLQFYMNGETLLPESLYLECDIQLEQMKKISVIISNLEEDKNTN